MSRGVAWGAWPVTASLRSMIFCQAPQGCREPAYVVVSAACPCCVIAESSFACASHSFLLLSTPHLPCPVCRYAGHNQEMATFVDPVGDRPAAVLFQ